MSDVVVAFFVPTVVFLVIVAPLWILMHYRSKQRSMGQLSVDERQLLEQLAVRAERMGERIETLEAILDDETPGWRSRLSASEYPKAASEYSKVAS
ncbi:MAG TPA: envelope stress response membrane protein PspB [Pseudomonadales bacterium]|jgi:phage shock protein B